jgi:hypothetical protein
MKNNRVRIARMKKLEPLPLPESLERAFSEIEKPAPRYADTAGQESPAVEHPDATSGQSKVSIPSRPVKVDLNFS